MAKYLIEDTTLTEIADAIRAKTGTTDAIKVSEMATQIENVTGGGSSDKIILAEQTFEGFASNAALDGAYTFEFEAAPVLVIGESYTVKWEDSEYTCVAQDFSALSAGMVAIGNLANFGGSGNNEPFIINYNASTGGGGILSFDTETSHKVGIYQKAESGGSVEGVHFVTFMSEDGSTELYKRPVADGDDCADPVIRGLISEPTKESTAQYNYTHVGWSASANGALDENILKAVTADKTVYANYAAVLRYYTVTYLDDDGVTVLKTESLAYGATPNYVPTKDDYDFVAWVPDAVVTGEMTYTASWKKKAAFATSTWAEIAAVCEAGNAASTYALGDTKDVTLTDGNFLTLEIIGFNHDDLADGSGKAPITLMVKNSSLSNVKTWSAGSRNNYWTTGTIRPIVQGYLDLFPNDLKELVKSVNKYTHEGKDATTSSTGKTASVETLWLPSMAETVKKNGNVIYTDGTQYSYFATAANRIRYFDDTAVSYHLRSTPHMFNEYSMSVGTTGVLNTPRTGGQTAYIIFGFCI